MGTHARFLGTELPFQTNEATQQSRCNQPEDQNPIDFHIK
jgi:hypothetical protein